MIIEFEKPFGIGSNWTIYYTKIYQITVVSPPEIKSIKKHL